MTIESNYAITALSECDWLKNLAPLFQPMESKTKTNRTLYACSDFPRALSKLQVIARNFDWFIPLFAPFVIGWSNCFGFGFSTVN